MRLLEHQAKALLAAYGVKIPTGALWPSFLELAYPVMVKAQLFEGGRGKRGGVRVEHTAEAVSRQSLAMLRGNALLPAAQSVLIEERLDVAREVYVALMMDRGSRSPLLVGHPFGGVNVETAAVEGLLKVELSPLASMPAFAMRRMASVLQLPSSATTQMGELLEAIWNAFNHEDCLLLELNPLVLTTTGELVAADARLVLDDSATERNRSHFIQSEGTSFESACHRLGATAVEMDGNIAIVTSGAGLGMATLDMIAALGGRARCVVDLAGTVFTGREAMSEVLGLVYGLSPRVLIINCFFQLARCDVLASAVSHAKGQPSGCTIVVRIRGKEITSAVAILESTGALVTADLEDACEEAVNRAMEQGAG